jgi:hypothetical protein
MLSPPIVGLIIFAVVLAATFAGWVVGQHLPVHHTTPETRTLVSVSMAVVGTVSALVLGLLISNANTAFIARSDEITTLSANLLRLDEMLRIYGSEADPARDALRQYAEQKSADLFPKNREDAVRLDDQSTYELLIRIEIILLNLKPEDPVRRWALGQALTLAADIGNTRWLLALQKRLGIPRAFLALVGFWLGLLFASFGLFSPRNLTAAVVLTLCALAISGAVEMILELEQPYSGFVRLSARPLRHAVETLAR